MLKTKVAFIDVTTSKARPNENDLSSFENIHEVQIAMKLPADKIFYF